MRHGRSATVVDDFTSAAADAIYDYFTKKNTAHEPISFRNWDGCRIHSVTYRNKVGKKNKKNTCLQATIQSGVAYGSTSWFFLSRPISLEHLTSLLQSNQHARGLYIYYIDLGVPSTKWLKSTDSTTNTNREHNRNPCRLGCILALTITPPVCGQLLGMEM